jgi:hypothetical protein
MKEERAATLVEQYALPPEEIEPLSIERLGLRLEGMDGLGEAEQEMMRPPMAVRPARGFPATG